MFSLRNVTAVLPVIAIYAVAAAGLVPHMVFLVDYVARGLGKGLAGGSLYWVIFGIGAAFGPLTTGRAADRIGFSAAIRIGLALQLAAVLLPVLFPVAPSLALSAFVMGAFTPGMAPLVLGRMAELTPGQDQRGAWTLATLGFALAQAGGAWLLSAVFDRTEAYGLLFGIGGGAIALALLLSLLHRQPVPLAQQGPPAK